MSISTVIIVALAALLFFVLLRTRNIQSGRQGGSRHQNHHRDQPVPAVHEHEAVVAGVDEPAHAEHKKHRHSGCC